MQRERLVRAGLAYYGITQLALGVWMALAPGSFFDALGGFGTQNDHYVRDVASWELALGVACLLVTRRAAGARARAAVLLFAGLQASLHAVNHVADADIAHHAWVGVADAVSLAALGAALLALWRITTRMEAQPT